MAVPQTNPRNGGHTSLAAKKRERGDDEEEISSVNAVVSPPPKRFRGVDEPASDKGNQKKNQLDWRMKPEKSFSDWTIEVSSGQQDGPVAVYHVHRSVLVTGDIRSLLLAKEFDHKASSNLRTTRIKLDGAHLFPILLDYLYGIYSSKERISMDDLVQLLKMANRLDVEGVDGIIKHLVVQIPDTAGGAKTCMSLYAVLRKYRSNNYLPVDTDEILAPKIATLVFHGHMKRIDLSSFAPIPFHLLITIVQQCLALMMSKRASLMNIFDRLTHFIQEAFDNIQEEEFELFRNFIDEIFTEDFWEQAIKTFPGNSSLVELCLLTINLEYSCMHVALSKSHKTAKKLIEKEFAKQPDSSTLNYFLYQACHGNFGYYKHCCANIPSALLIDISEKELILTV